MKQWKCQVCGYIHKGDNPPDKCPVCGADKSQFIEISIGDKSDEPTSTKSTAENKLMTLSSLSSLTQDIVLEHHLHPISVHFPNGVIPISFLFILLSTLCTCPNLITAAFYNTVIIMFSMPIVLITGYIEWKKRYGGYLTNLFITKISCGILVWILSIILSIWSYIQPSMRHTDQGVSGIYILFYLIMLIAAGIAGHIGGKLVFKTTK